MKALKFQPPGHVLVPQHRDTPVACFFDLQPSKNSRHTQVYQKNGFTKGQSLKTGIGNPKGYLIHTIKHRMSKKMMRHRKKLQIKE